jgi:hypothetical protein
MYYLITSSTRYVLENNCLLFLFVLFFLSIVVGEIGIQLKLQPAGYSNDSSSRPTADHEMKV